MFLTMLTKDTAYLCEDFIPDRYLDRTYLLGVICLSTKSEPMGAAVVLPEENRMSLHWIYVLPEYRNKGVGSLLIKGVLEMAKAQEAKTLETYMVGYFPEEDISEDEDPWGDETYDEDLLKGLENALEQFNSEEYLYDSTGLEESFSDKIIEPQTETLSDSEILEEFFVENGFLMTKEHEIYAFRIIDVFSSPKLRVLAKARANCISFDSLSESQKAQVGKLLEENDYPDYISICSEELSYACFSENGSCVGVVITKNSAFSKTLDILLLYTVERNPEVYAGLLNSLVRDANCSLTPDYIISFVAAGDEGLHQAEKLLNDKNKLFRNGTVLHGIMEIA